MSWIRKLLQTILRGNNARRPTDKPIVSNDVYTSGTVRLIRRVSRRNIAKIRPPDRWLLTWELELEGDLFDPFVCPQTPMRANIFEQSLAGASPKVGDRLHVTLRRSRFDSAAAWIAEIAHLDALDNETSSI